MFLVELQNLFAQNNRFRSGVTIVALHFDRGWYQFNFILFQSKKIQSSIIISRFAVEMSFR